MSRRLVNALLLAAIAALVLSGALGWLVHDASVAPAVALHRIVGIGYPVRLIVPGYRGYQWVKWVDRLEVS